MESFLFMLPLARLVEIQRLMTAIIYATSPNTTSPSNLANSPYADLFQPRLWDEVEQQFTREFCSLLGMSQESPLAIAVNVGATAVPTLIKVRSVLDERKKQKPTVEYWSIEDELPVGGFD